MALSDDQAAKAAKRKAAHAALTNNANMPGTPVSIAQTDPATVLAKDATGNTIAPIAYPSPPF